MLLVYFSTLNDCDCATLHMRIKPHQLMTSPSPPPNASGTNLGATQESSAESSQSTDDNWVVQDILAERTTVTGENEVLVIWKASWIPVANLRDGPVLRAWRLTPMFTTAAMRMQVMVAMEPGRSWLRMSSACKLQHAHPKNSACSVKLLTAANDVYQLHINKHVDF